MQYDREAHLKAKQAEAEGLEKYMAARTKWIFLMIGATTTWIMIAGFVAWRWPSLVRKGYRPFADDFTGKHGRIIFIAGIILTALTGASFFVVVS